MHPRIPAIVSASRSKLRRRHRFVATKYFSGNDSRGAALISQTSCDSSLHTLSGRTTRPQHMLLTGTNNHDFFRRSFTSTPAASLQADQQTEQDDELARLDQDIHRFTNSSLTELLPSEIFYQDDESSNHEIYQINSLDQELGVDTVWEESEQQQQNATDNDELNSEEELPFIPKSASSSITRQATHRTAMNILRNFDPQDPPQSDNLEEIQVWLECAAQREAVLRYQKLIDTARDRNSFESMSMMKKCIVQWYQSVRDEIEAKQKEYLTSQNAGRAKKRYGPLLCSLNPEKLAILVANEAITYALVGGNNVKRGIPLVKMAIAIGSAVETEVVSQRRIKERFYKIKSEEEEEDNEYNSKDSDERRETEIIAPASKEPLSAVERWTFSASHLKKYLEELNRINPKLGKSKRAVQYAMHRAKQAMDSDEKWTSEDLTHLGAVLLSILMKCAYVNDQGKQQLAFSIEKKWTAHGKSQSYIVLNDSLYRLFLEDDFLSFAATTTRHTPMIVPPTDWSGPFEGGYRWLKVDLMRTHGCHFQKEALQHGNLSMVADGLNILGKTSWRVNETILDIAQHCWENNIAIGDIPPRTDHEIPPEPSRPERIDPEVYADAENPVTQATVSANKIFRENSARRTRLQQKNMDLRSLRCSAILKLNQAKKFKDFEKIYFPYNLDFRGRAYPIPPHFSNVGSDLCRGMLTFAEPKPLGKRGLYWLKVHLANFAGKDKMSFDDRASFIDQNMEHVRNAVANPFGDDPWWMGLEDPFQGLATCREIVQAIGSGDPESYLCSLPVHMDGSCNGLQHYAALGKDTAGGKAVNLLEGDGPRDVYFGVMEEVTRRVAKEAATTLDFDTSDPDELDRTQKKRMKHNEAAKLVDGLIDRGVVKRTVMTSVYGVTYVGARLQIQEKIEEKLEGAGYDIDSIGREVFSAAGYLATLTIEVMGDLFQGARKTKDWLAECARLISQQGHPVAWISPIGVPAIQPYRQRRPRTIVTVLQSVTITDENDDLPVHKSRQSTAFPPNYVHSLDSSHMLLTAIEMDRRGLAFSAVHDSFWTHACDVEEMNEALRDCFVDLYSQPLLADLKESWELRYPEVEFPDLPDLGDLDLNEVKDATYFFQ